MLFDPVPAQPPWMSQKSSERVPFVLMSVIWLGVLPQKMLF